MLKIKKLRETAILPRRGSKYAAGYDLIIDEQLSIGEGLHKIPLGFAIEIPKNHYARIACRSSLAAAGFSVEAGVVDEDYKGEIMVMLRCRKAAHLFLKGSKIAQMIITPYASLEVLEVGELLDTERGTGGFGSTDKK